MVELSTQGWRLNGLSPPPGAKFMLDILIDNKYDDLLTGLDADIAV